MLILTRKESEQICLGDEIVITVVRLSGDKVRIGVSAPPQVKVIRSELKELDARAIDAEDELMLNRPRRAA